MPRQRCRAERSRFRSSFAGCFFGGGLAGAFALAFVWGGLGGGPAFAVGRFFARGFSLAACGFAAWREPFFAPRLLAAGILPLFQRQKPTSVIHRESRCLDPFGQKSR